MPKFFGICAGGSFTAWMVLPTSGASGGIILMWDERAVECIEEVVGTFSLSCKFKSVMDQFVWAFSGVYGPGGDSDRHYLWVELSGVFSWWEVSWCIKGDFNVTHFPNGSVLINLYNVEFSNFISE